jgi:hypothetical protein
MKKELAGESKTDDFEPAPAEPVAEQAVVAGEPPPPPSIPEPVASEPIADQPAVIAETPAPPSTPEPLPRTLTTPSPPYAAQPAWTPPATPPGSNRGGAWTAIGVVFVVSGLFFLAIRLLGIDLDLSGNVWPLVVILPGLTLLVVGFASLGTGAAVPGGIVTMLGLVLAYQASTGDWASWTWVWPLVVPGGVGLGVYLRGLRSRNAGQTRGGIIIIFVSVVITMTLFVFFENVLQISANVIDYGWPGQAVLPTLLILLGIVLLARNMRRRQQS